MENIKEPLLMKEDPIKSTIGLWEQGKRLVSQTLRKKDIPSHCRLMFVKNKMHYEGSKRPLYMGYFVETSDKDAVDIARPFQVLASEMKAQQKMQTLIDDIHLIIKRWAMTRPCISHYEPSEHDIWTMEKYLNDIENIICEYI